MFRNTSHDGYTFDHGADPFVSPALETSVPPAPANEDGLDVLRDALTTQYPDHESFIAHSDLFKPSMQTYTDMPAKESKNTLLRCHRIMTRLREMDELLLNAQRQGRVSFYLTCRGEEAMTIGSASALKSGDVLLTQYREQGLFMWRGFTLDQFMNQVRQSVSHRVVIIALSNVLLGFIHLTSPHLDSLLCTVVYCQ